MNLVADDHERLVVGFHLVHLIGVGVRVRARVRVRVRGGQGWC